MPPDPGNDAGGTERLCAYLAALLARLGLDVAVVGPAGRGPGRVDRHGASTLWQAGSAWRASRALGPADLVVTCGFLGWPGRSGGRRVHVYVGNLLRLAPHLEGHWHWRARWAAAGGLAEGLAARGARVVAISEQAADDARRLYRARVSAVLPLGVDTGLFRPRDRPDARRRLGLADQARYALLVGRGERGKGPGVALDACRRGGLHPPRRRRPPGRRIGPLGILSRTCRGPMRRPTRSSCLPATRGSGTWRWSRWPVGCPSSPRRQGGLGILAGVRAGDVVHVEGRFVPALLVPLVPVDGPAISVPDGPRRRSCSSWTTTPCSVTSTRSRTCWRRSPTRASPRWERPSS